VVVLGSTGRLDVTLTMAASCSKKRKISDECHVIQEKWTSLYLFTEFQQKPVCLVCIESIVSIKEYNLKRHYETKHAAKFWGVPIG
jgi:hypothetical protein